MAGDPPGGGAAGRQPHPQLTVQRPAHRHRPVLIQRIVDELVPERQHVAVGLHDPGPHHGPEGLGQGQDVPVGQHRELGHVDGAAADGGRPEELDRLGLKQAEPVQDADGQARGRSAAVHLGLPGRGDEDPLLLDEPGEKLDDEQRVAGGPGHLVGQVRTGRTAGELPGQREHRLGVKRAQVKHGAPALAAGFDQGYDRLLVGRPRTGQDQRRIASAQPHEPPQHRQARVVRPVQVVDHEQELGRGAERLEYADKRFDNVVDFHGDVLEVPRPGAVSLDAPG